MRKISSIFGNKNGMSFFPSSPCNEEMAAIILTRWAKRRLPFVREARILKQEQLVLEEAQYQEAMKRQEAA